MRGKEENAPEDSSSAPLGDVNDLLRKSGVDPTKVQATNLWVKRPDVSVHIRPIPVMAESLTLAEVEELLKQYPTPDSRPADVDKTFLVAIADQQLGKPDKGGTAAVITRWSAGVADAAERITTETETGKAGKLILAHLGDACEGAVSQSGRLRHDVGITDEVQIAVRMLLDTIFTLAPLTSKMLIGAVPSNHGESRRDRATEPLDNWCIGIVKLVEQTVRLLPSYDHVEFHYPDDDEVSLALTLETGFSVGMAHGHTGPRNSNAVPDWILKQISGGQPLADCQIILTGHFHHTRIEDIGNGRVWLQCPALEGGSDWFRHRTGKDSAKGILTAWLNPSRAVPVELICWG